MKNLNPFLLFSILLINACSSSDQPQEVDILITGGSVFTGESNEMAPLELGITQNTITYVGSKFGGKAGKVIDAKGLVVSPGFIDMHTHLEPLMQIPDAKSHLLQGSTTALGGLMGVVSGLLLITWILLTTSS